MSYLSQPTSTTDFGVVKIGSNVLVTDGVISIEQSLAPNASVTFGSVNVSGNLYSFGNQVVTSVTPSNGKGIVLQNVVTNGPAASFEIDNTGVVDFTAGTGLASTNHSGNITVTNTGVVKLTANVGIGLSGSSGNVVITNTGVTQLTAGSGISLTGSTGNILISGSGTTFFNTYGTTGNYTATLTDEYIGVYSAAGCTITLPSGIDGRVYYIKDEYGQGSGKITIQPSGTDLIDGKSNYVISVPYQCVASVYRAGQWRII